MNIIKSNLLMNIDEDNDLIIYVAGSGLSSFYDIFNKLKVKSTTIIFFIQKIDDYLNFKLNE